MRGVLAWRPRSTPERLGLTGLGLAAATLVYAPLHQATGLGVFCPLRTLTGVPCPLCGMTTAATELAARDLDGALAANPFVLVLVANTAVMSALVAARALGLARPAAPPWPARRNRAVVAVVGMLAAASWLFQLNRFGWL